MVKWMGPLVCALPKWAGGGHRRGKFIDEFSTESGRFRRIVCSRCGREKFYKVKPPAAAKEAA